MCPGSFRRPGIHAGRDADYSSYAICLFHSFRPVAEWFFPRRMRRFAMTERYGILKTLHKNRRSGENRTGRACKQEACGMTAPKFIPLVDYRPLSAEEMKAKGVYPVFEGHWASSFVLVW